MPASMLTMLSLLSVLGHPLLDCNCPVTPCFFDPTCRGDTDKFGCEALPGKPLCRSCGLVGHNNTACHPAQSQAPPAPPAPPLTPPEAPFPFFVVLVECREQWHNSHAGDAQACMQIHLNSVSLSAHHSEEFVPVSAFDPSADYASVFDPSEAPAEGVNNPEMPGFILRNTLHYNMAFPIDVWLSDADRATVETNECTMAADEFGALARFLATVRCSWKDVATHARCYLTDVQVMLSYQRAAVRAIREVCPNWGWTWNQVFAEYTSRDIIGLTYTEGHSKEIAREFFSQLGGIFLDDLFCVSRSQLLALPVHALYKLKCKDIF